MHLNAQVFSSYHAAFFLLYDHKKTYLEDPTVLFAWAQALLRIVVGFWFIYISWLPNKAIKLLEQAWNMLEHKSTSNVRFRKL